MSFIHYLFHILTSLLLVWYPEVISKGNFFEGELKMALSL